MFSTRHLEWLVLINLERLFKKIFFFRDLPRLSGDRLNGVALLITDPPSTSFNILSKKKKKKFFWHMTWDTWHVTGVHGWTFSQNLSSLALTTWNWRCFEDIFTKDKWLTQSMNERMNDSPSYSGSVDYRPLGGPLYTLGGPKIFEHLFPYLVMYGAVRDSWVSLILSQQGPSVVKFNLL